MSHFSKRKAKKQEAATTSREIGKVEEVVAAPVLEEFLPVAAEDTTGAAPEAETAVEEETLPVEEDADREAAPAEESAPQTTDILADLQGETEEKISSEIEEMKAKLYGTEEAEPTTGFLCCA